MLVAQDGFGGRQDWKREGIRDGCETMAMVPCGFGGAETIISGGNALREVVLQALVPLEWFPATQLMPPQPLVVHATASVTVTVVRNCSRGRWEMRKGIGSGTNYMCKAI